MGNGHVERAVYSWRERNGVSRDEPGVLDHFDSGDCRGDWVRGGAAIDWRGAGLRASCRGAGRVRGGGLVDGAAREEKSCDGGEVGAQQPGSSTQIS